MHFLGKKNFLLFRSLRWQLISLAFVGMGVLAAGVILLSQKSANELITEEIKGMVAQTTFIMNMAIAPMSTAGELEVFSEFVGELLQSTEVDGHSGLTYIVVADHKGRRIVNVGTQLGELPEPDALPHENFLRGEIHVRQPILLRGAEVGFLQYGVATRNVVEAAKAARWRLALWTTGLIMLFTGVVFWAGLRLAMRLEHLTDVATQVASGDYSPRANEDGGDEVAQVSRHFNLMTAAISERVRELESTKAALENLNANLESIVARRTRQLSEKTEQLERNFAELSQTRDQLIKSERLAALGSMVAGVAHELNTPIGTAMLASSTLSDATEGFNHELQAGLRRSSLTAYLDNVRTGSDLIGRNLSRAAALIGSFKQVAVNQTADQPTPFSLRRAMEELAVVLGPSLKKSPYSLQIDIPDDITMSSYLGSLEQIITNFVNNATLHAFAGRSEGAMRLSAQRVGTDRVAIHFSDNGNGIAPEVLPKIFDPFFSTRFGQGGSGLGLSIVYNIVTMLLNGHISATSEPGVGTTLVVDIPLVVEPIPPPA